MIVSSSRGVVFSLANGVPLKIDLRNADNETLKKTDLAALACFRLMASNQITIKVDASRLASVLENLPSRVEVITQEGVVKSYEVSDVVAMDADEQAQMEEELRKLLEEIESTDEEVEVEEEQTEEPKVGFYRAHKRSSASIWSLLKELAEIVSTVENPTKRQVLLEIVQKMEETARKSEREKVKKDRETREEIKRLEKEFRDWYSIEVEEPRKEGIKKERDGNY